MDAATLTSSGFVLDRDGFSFANYGNEATPQNLTSSSMKSLYGSAVCARSTATGCELTAPAAAWQALANGSMDGGHCFGMAALAALIYDGKLEASSFGAPTTYALKDSAGVQGEIAKLFITQGTDPERTTKQKLSVADVLSTIQTGWAQHKTYLLAIHTADRSGGHAVTPVALRRLAGGLVDLFIYDNNFPGKERTIRLDPKADTWTYTTSTNPAEAAEEFSGDASNQMELFTPSDALVEQGCPFCKASDAGFSYVVLDPGSAQAGVTVSVTSPTGQPLAGVQKVTWLTGDDDDTLLRVPASAGTYRVNLVGSDVKAGSTANGAVSIVGAGWTDAVSAVQLSRGESDAVTVGADGTFTYATGDAESPMLSNTVDEGGTSYRFAFRGARIDADGGSYTVSVDPKSHVERIVSAGTGGSRMAFAFTRISATSNQTFSTGVLSVGDGQAVFADYGVWKGDGTPLTVGIGTAASGKASTTVALQDR